MKVALVLTAIFCALPSSDAQIIPLINTLNNTVAGVPLIEGPAGTNPNQELAQGFTPGEKIMLTGATLEFQRFNGGGTIEVRLLDTGGNSLLTLSGPSDPLAGQPSGTFGTENYTGTFILNANTTYWIEAIMTSPQSSAYGWPLASSVSGSGGESFLEFAHTGSDANLQSQFSYWLPSGGTRLVEAFGIVVPEPGTWTMLASTAMLAFAFVLRFERGQNK